MLKTDPYLEVDGLFNKLCAQAAINGRALRPKQLVYAKRWLAAQLDSLRRFNAGNKDTGIVLAEADTGTGKTMGYALPLMAVLSVTGKRGAIGTSTHQLQRQMLAGDLSRINDWLEACGRPKLNLAILVGRAAFVSAEAIAHLQSILSSTKGATREQLEFLDKLQPWAQAANRGENSGLLVDALRDLGYDTLPDGLSTVELVLGPGSSDEDSSCYDRHLVAAEQANLVLLTQHRLAAGALFGHTDIQSNLDILVIDEADQLTNVVTSMLHFELSLTRLQRLLQQLRLNEASRLTGTLLTAVQQVPAPEQAIPMMQVPEQPRIAVLTAAEALLPVLRTSLKQLPAARVHDTEDLAQAVHVLQQFVKSCHPPQGLFFSALSFSPTRKLPSLAVAPMYPGRLLANLWKNDNSKLAAVLLTAATLAEPGKQNDPVSAFTPVALDFGLLKNTAQQKLEHANWGVYSPERFGKLRFILPDPAVVPPVSGVDDEGCAMLDPGWVSYAIKQILAAAKNPNQRTLVLVRSYADVAALSAGLSGLGPRLLAQPRGMPLQAAATEFVRNPGTVWLSPTAWVGLDLPGMIDNLIIPRIPFIRDSALLRALLKAYSLYTNQAVDSIMHARRMLQAKRLLRQGIGRGIRKEDDRCAIWFGDPRFPVPPTNSNLRQRASCGKAVRGVARTHPSLLGAIPGRFQPAISSTLYSPAIFWND